MIQSQPEAPRGIMRLDDTDRLEAFSDGVMAVIITIMAFNVKPPLERRSQPPMRCSPSCWCTC